MRERVDALLTFKRARTYASVLVALYVVAWVYVVVHGSPPLNSAGEPIGGDYIAFHTAGRLLLAGRGAELYDHAAVVEIQGRLLTGRVTEFYDAFRNPPFAALPFVAVGGLDLLPGLAVWTLVSSICLGVSFRLLLQEVPWLQPRWRGLSVLVLAFAPVYFGIIDGQNATVSLLLYVLIYRALVRDRSWRAGAWAALGMFKPQLFLLFPLIFLARRDWRALLGYGLTLGVLAVVSVALVGLDGMRAWLGILFEPETGNATANAWRMASLKSFFDLMLPGQAFVSLGLYLASSVALTMLLLLAWARRMDALPVLWALTSLVAVLVDPHLIDYDLSVLVAAGVLAAARVPQLRWWLVLLFVVLVVRVQLPIGAASVKCTVPVLAVCAYVVLRAMRRNSPEASLVRAAPARAATLTT